MFELRFEVRTLEQKDNRSKNREILLKLEITMFDEDLKAEHLNIRTFEGRTLENV
jgi:hypothetical protein